MCYFTLDSSFRNPSSAVSTLLKSVEEEQNSTLSDEDTESQISKRMKSVFSEGASSFGSSFNQGMFFMSQVYKRRIINYSQ